MTDLLSELEVVVVTDEDVEASGLAYFEQQWDMLPPRSKAIYRHAIRRALTAYASRLPHHAEIAAAARDASGKRSEWWSVQRDDELQASSDSLPDALHYLSVYQQDGPAQLVHVVTYSETITPEQIAAMQKAKSHE